MDLHRDEPEGRVPSESNDTIVSRLAKQDKIPWYSKPNLRLLYFLMVLACLTVQMAAGFDASMANGLQAIPSWLEYFNHPRSASLGLMIAMYPLGAVTALPFFPPVVDKIGRRSSIFLGGLISIVGGILQGCAPDFITFICSQFILGFAKALCTIAASTLVAELSHPKERTIVGALFTTSYDIGAVAAAAVTLKTFAMTSNWGWRIPLLLQVVPGLFQVVSIWFLPESPRWLISRGRGKEAHAILVTYHAEGDNNSEFVKAEYNQIVEALESEQSTVHVGRKESLSAPGMRQRVIITAFLGLSSQWSGIGLISYFLTPILDTIGIHDNYTKNVTNLARFSWSLVNSTFIALIVHQYPRRRIFLTCSVSLFIVFTAWTIASAEYSFTHSKISAQVVLVLIFVYSPAYNIGFNTMTYTYVAEIFPFHVRASGIALFQWWYCGGAFFNQFVNPIGIDLSGWRWYIFYCVWNAFQVLVVYFMFPETSGRTLEELTFLYEDDRRQELPRNPELEPLLEHGPANDRNPLIETGRFGQE